MKWPISADIKRIKERLFQQEMRDFKQIEEYVRIQNDIINKISESMNREKRVEVERRKQYSLSLRAHI